MRRYLTVLLTLSVMAIPAFAAGEMKHGEMTASDAVKIHYIEQGEGVPVILVHGYINTLVEFINEHDPE